LSFVHLQVKSAYSLLSSAASIHKLVEEAEKNGFSALALTDEHVMYGAIAFYKLCKKKGIKPILGLTASVQIKEEAYPFVLLAKNHNGYKNLLKMSSLLQTKYRKGLPLSLFKSYCHDLFVLTPGMNGIIERLLLEEKREEAYKAALYFQQMMEEDSFYLSVQQHGLKEEKILLEKLRKLGAELNIPLVATNDVLYVHREDAFAQHCLVAIKNGTQIEQGEEAFINKNYHLKSINEMMELFKETPEAIRNAEKIAKQCQLDLRLGQLNLPKYPVPEGLEKNQYLEQLCLEGLKKRIPNPTDEYVDRLLYELDIIKKMQFSDYFLIVWDFMRYAHEQGIVTGPGRGSAAGSLVAYVLNITDVDPIKYHLLFERFLNPERVTMPDIDIDFPDTRRDEMISYVAKKYGKAHVAQIITFGTLAAKAAIRDVARVLGASQKEVDLLAKLIPSKPGITLREAYEESASLRERISQSVLAKKIFDIAVKVEGLPRHSSTHAAGVVISEKPLTEMIPIQEGHHDIYLTQFSMEHLEDVGLLKMDFLGLRNLTLIENIKALIQKYEGKKISFEQIGYEDDLTFSILSKGDTTGVFQLESEGMRHVLKRLKPSSLEDIVAVNALYRPGPMENIPLFIDRKHGRLPIQYPHDDLKDILKNTYGIIVYQEQIMEIAAKMAGFSLGEADLLRRAVGKKIKSLLDEKRDHFVRGCIRKGYTKEAANHVYDLIVKFANYGFNRSHAVAYSMIAFQLAYLKAHYPLYFMSALLTSVSGNESKIAQYIREGKQKGIRFLPPSINKSGYHFLVEQGGIRYSLASIKNVGYSALKEIFTERKKRPFTDLFDFCVRISPKSVNRRTIESLIFSGAMDEFGEDRATLLASIDVALNHAELLKMDDKEQMDLFLEEEMNIKPKYVKVEPLNIEEKLKFEKQVLGFYFSSHPVDSFAAVLNAEGAIQIANSLNKVDQQVKLGAYLMNVKPIRTKKGETMAFAHLSDSSGEIDAVIFPSHFRKYRDKLKNGTVVLLAGKIEKRQNQLQLIVNHVHSIEELKEKKREGALFLKIEEETKKKGNLYKLKEIIRRYPGSVPVYVYYEFLQKTVKLPADFSVEPNPVCVQRLSEILGRQNVVFKKE
jgi:DNA polymerase-3 subunit alpha